MKAECEIVRDLLPLYIDGVSSKASARLVESHTRDCGDCGAMLRAYQAEGAEQALQGETGQVLEQAAKRFRRRSATVGGVIAGILLVPVLVCLIVNLASGAGLSWFFIVLTSLMTAASLLVVPLVVPRARLRWTLGCFTGCLLLLLGVCCLYTGGDWFLVAASGCLLGLSTALLPFALKGLRHRALLCFGADTALLALLLLSVGLRTPVPGFGRDCAAICLPLAGFCWALLLCIRYLPLRRLGRGAVCCLLTGAFGFCANNVINGLLGVPLPWPVLRLDVWSAATIDGNVKWLLLLLGAALAAALGAAAAWSKRKENRK